MNFDKNGLLQEVESYEMSAEINYSKLAEKYGVYNKMGQLSKNGGQSKRIFKRAEY